MNADSTPGAATADGLFSRAGREASRAGHPDAAFFAAVLGKSLALGDLGRTGLSSAQLFDLLAAVFPDANDSGGPVLGELRQQILRCVDNARPTPVHQAFMAQTQTLLDAYRAPHATTPWVTRILIHACLRTDHLWRDLGLAGREDVTALLRRHYPGLPERNVRNLRWKKFLAYAARERAGLAPQAAPGCAGCEEEAMCYPAEAERTTIPIDVIRTR